MNDNPATQYLEYGPLAFLYWDDIERINGINRTRLDIELERRSIQYGQSEQYRKLKARRAGMNG